MTSSWGASPTYTPASGALDAEIKWFWRVETRDNHGATRVPTTGFVLRRSALGYNGFSGYFKGLNTLGGNYVFSETDAKFATLGSELALTRTFNTQDTHNGVFGRGWSTPYFMDWSTSGSNIVITYPDGRREVHTPNGSGGWIPPAGYANTLSGTPAGGLTLKMPDNSIYTFATGTTTGRLAKIKDSYGRELTIVYNFAASPPQIVITDVASQRAMTVKVTGTLADFRITSVEVPNPAGGVLSWTYTYDTTSVPGTALLTSACDARGTTGFCNTYSWDTTKVRLWKVYDRKGQLDVQFGRSPDPERLGGERVWVHNTDGSYDLVLVEGRIGSAELWSAEIQVADATGYGLNIIEGFWRSTSSSDAWPCGRIAFQNSTVFVVNRGHSEVDFRRLIDALEPVTKEAYELWIRDLPVER